VYICVGMGEGEIGGGGSERPFCPGAPEKNWKEEQAIKVLYLFVSIYLCVCVFFR
jgi:hypothetical protein